MEKYNHNIPLIFAEMLKDEINATDEHILYNGFKRAIRKFSKDNSATTAIDEFTRVLSGGASLEQIIQVTIDEAFYPSAESQMTIEAAEIFDNNQD